MMLPKSAEKIRSTLFDEAVPIRHRIQLLGHVCQEEEIAEAVVGRILKDAATPAAHKSVHAKKARELTQLLEEMQQGPLRTGTFLRMVRRKGGAARAHVLLEDGAGALVVVPDPKLSRSLRAGDAVVLEGQGKAVLFRDEVIVGVGEEARFERVIPEGRVEVSLRDEPRVMHASAHLLEQIGAGEVVAGQQLLVCVRRSLAFDAIPQADGFAHFRFLSRDAVPDVVLERDMAAPPPILGELLETARLQLQDQEICRRYGLARCVTALLAGVPGTGKTLSVHALWRGLYEIMAATVGVPIDELPPRVFQLRMSDVLSKWLGEAEKNLDRYFDEIESLASEPYRAPDGTEHQLPVLVVLEEIDGLASARGGGEPILDRILTTVLRRLDPSRPQMRDSFVFFVGTTNIPEAVDPAFLRRLGGTVVRFERLNRVEFDAVLETHLRDRPLAAVDGGADATLGHTVAAVAGWVFGEKDSEPGLVELQFVGAGSATRKFRRDFLTPSLVDRAVQDAAWRACRRAYEGGPEGVTVPQLIDAFDRQIRAVVDQLQPGNVQRFVDLPDGVRVATVRRVQQPALPHHRLEVVA